MQVTIFIALMASLVLASPIGRYRDHVLKPRYPQEGAPYANSTSSISASVSASSAAASELMFIIPSTSITASQPFSSAVVPSRSFQNVKDGAPISTPDVASLTTITLTKTVGSPVKTTQKLSSSTSIPKVTSSASRKSFEHPSDAASLTSVVVLPGTTVIASTFQTSLTSDVAVTSSASSIAVTNKTLTASTVTGSTSDAVVTPSASSIAVPDKTLTASTVTGSTSDAVVTPSTSSTAVPNKTLTASVITGSTSDAVVTPSASSIVVPDNTLTASAITGSAVVTPSTSDTMSTVKYEPTSGLLSSVRYPIGTKPVTSSKPATTSAAVVTSETAAISKPATTSAAVVTSEPAAISKPVTTSAAVVTSEPVAISKPVTTSAAVVTSEPVATSKPATTSAAIVTSEPVATSKPATTSAAIVTSEPVATSKPATTSAVIVTSEPAVTSGSVAPTVSASQQSTATKSTEASPSAIAGDKFGNKQLAITENKGFSTLTSTSKCDPAEMSTQNACINGAFAQCGSNGVYIIVSPCSAPTKCFSMPLELSVGTSVGCTTPDDAAYRMGLASAAELVTLISRRHVDDGAPGLAPTSAALPVAASTAISSASQEPRIPVPSGLKTSEARSLTSTKACASSAPYPTAAASSASQEPKIPVPSGLKTSEVSSPTPTTEAGGFASSAPIPTATIDTSLPAKVTAAVSSVSQEPKLPVPSGLLTSEVRLPPTLTAAPSSITSAPVPGPSIVTITIATTVTVKG